MTSYKQLKHVLVILLLGLSLSGCDNKSESTEAATTQKVVTLSNTNIAKFKRAFIHDYIKRRNDLLAQFKEYKKKNDAYGFTQYRNFKWTPGYIEKKDYYRAVVNKNERYISQESLQPLFDTYANLLYIGVDLKNALLDNNKDLLKKAYAEIKADHATIKKYQD